LLSRLPIIIESLVRLWGPPTTFLSKLKTGRSLALDFSKDETHNRYAIQDQIIHIVEPLFSAFPTRFLMAILQLWKFSPTAALHQGQQHHHHHHHQQQQSSQAETFVPLDDLQLKLTIIEILNTMSNIDAENVTRSITEIVRWSHLEDGKKLQKVPAAKRRPGQVVVYAFTERIFLRIIFFFFRIGLTRQFLM